MTRCCPGEPRVEGVRTIAGEPVADLHRHDRMLRGTVGEKVMHWYANGRLTPLSKTESDLDLIKGVTLP